MVRTSYTRSYFNQALENANLIFKVAKTGCLVSFPFVAGFGYTINDFWLILALFGPSMYGIAMFTRQIHE